MSRTRSQPVALTVAGSDSGGGAGIQADLRTFTAFGVHGTSVVSAITAQNPKEVVALEPTKPAMVLRQLEAVFGAYTLKAAKTGMLLAVGTVECVAEFFNEKKRLPLVVDPVMISSSGSALLQVSALKALQAKLKEAQDESERLKAEAKLTEEFPNAEVLQISARTGDGLEAWFARITDAEQIARNVMEVDYELYAEGEALLGWLNATVQLSASEDFEARAVLEQFTAAIQAYLNEQGAEIAHLKMTLSPDAGLVGDVAIINLVRNDFVPELSADLDAPIESGQLIINLRAEGDPETLRTAVETALATAPAELAATLDHLEHFRPGKPEPTHRVTDLA